jgi:hypothetical protein
MWSPTLLFDRCVYGPEKMSSLTQKDFCNTICQTQTLVASYSRDVASEKRGQDQVKGDHRPQQDTGQTTCETEVGKKQRDQCAVGQHPDDWRTGSGGDA